MDGWSDCRNLIPRADGQTRNATEIMSKLFLSNAPIDVMKLWLDTITETKINPLQYGEFNVIKQLAQEQSFLTGNSDLFGGTVESTIAGVEKILRHSEMISAT